MKANKAIKRFDEIMAVVKRLRETTGASWSQIKDYCQRRGHWPLKFRSNFVAFCNESFVKNWTKRSKGGGPKCFL
jgi:hypothetical protein